MIDLLHGRRGDWLMLLVALAACTVSALRVALALYAGNHDAAWGYTAAALWSGIAVVLYHDRAQSPGDEW